MKVYNVKKMPWYKDVAHGVAYELAPNLIALICFLIIAQVVFFIIGPSILITKIASGSLFLLNLVFAIIVPYNLAMVIKAAHLIYGEVKQRG